MVIDTTKVLMEIIRSVITGSELSYSIKNIDDNELKNVFGLAQRHDLSHIVADCLLKNDMVALKELSDICKQVSLLALIRHQQQSYEYNRVCKLLEDKAIDFIPLKGAVIKEYYPQAWMRTSCDIDILIHPEDLDDVSRFFIDEYQYTVLKKTTHDVVFATEGGVHIELHFKLIDEDVKRNGEYLRKWNAECLKNVWDNTFVIDGAKYQHRLNDEIMYFYHIAHMAKHFETGGCGIKPFIDLWLLNNRIEFNSAKRKEILEKGNLSEFADNVNSLSQVWMDGKPHSDITNIIESYIISGGVYGTIQNKIAFNQSKTGSPFRYVLSRIFVSYDTLYYYFPILLRHKWLLPFCQVARWFKIIFKNSFKRSLDELGINSKSTDDTWLPMNEMIKKLGL